VTNPRRVVVVRPRHRDLVGERVRDVLAPEKNMKSSWSHMTRSGLITPRSNGRCPVWWTCGLMRCSQSDVIAPSSNSWHAMTIELPSPQHIIAATAPLGKGSCIDR
jgi:hypothetical protein